MEHYYQNIHGWMNYESLYAEMVDRFPSGSRFVEIGSWLGRSACYMGVEIVNSGKDIKLGCVDTWFGNIPELENEEVVINGTLYADFLKNIEPLTNMITPFRMPSVEAARLFDDESLDFVFIDGDHTERGINSDLKNWFPKVRQGGVIAGHDYDYPQISKALKLFFEGKRYEVILPNIWVHYKQ